MGIKWRDKPLRDLARIINLIKATTTDTGLKVYCVLDQNHCEKGKAVSDKVMGPLKLVLNSFRGEWNYSVFPKNLHGAFII